MGKKTKYRFRTAANLALLSYCASAFKDGYICMSEFKEWKFFIKKPTFNSGYWHANCKYEFLFYALKLPKRPSSFAKHSLIRIKDKRAWFAEWPDVVAASKF